MGLDTKTDRLTDFQSQCDSDSDSDASISHSSALTKNAALQRVYSISIHHAS
jgi:hypothetical protein